MNERAKDPKVAAYTQAPSAAGTAGRQDVLEQVKHALRALSRPDLSYAPATAEFIAAVDAPGETGKPKKYPQEIYADYFPEQNQFARPGKLVQPTQKILLAMVDEWQFTSGEKILSDDELATLQAIQAKVDQTLAQLAEFATTKTFGAFQNQSHELVAKTLASGALPEESQFENHETIANRFAAKRRALTELSESHCQEAFPLVLKAHAKAFEIVRSKMALLEEQERQIAKAFSAPWQPSYLWRACATFQMRMHPSRLTGAVGHAGTPRAMLEGIITL